MWSVLLYVPVQPLAGVVVVEGSRFRDQGLGYVFEGSGCVAIPRWARFESSHHVVSLDSRLESNKEEEKEMWKKHQSRSGPWWQDHQR